MEELTLSSKELLNLGIDIYMAIDIVMTEKNTSIKKYMPIGKEQLDFITGSDTNKYEFVVVMGDRRMISRVIYIQEIRFSKK